MSFGAVRKCVYCELEMYDGLCLLIFIFNSFYSICLYALFHGDRDRAGETFSFFLSFTVTNKSVNKSEKKRTRK